MKSLAVTSIGNLVRTSTFDLRKNKTQTFTLTTQNAYDGPVPLKIIKQKTSSVQYIPAEDKAYYENITENCPKYL